MGTSCCCGGTICSSARRGFGDEHEQRHLDELRTRVGDNVTIIGRADLHPRRARRRSRRDEKCGRSTITVIAQAIMFDVVDLSASPTSWCSKTVVTGFVTTKLRAFGESHFALQLAAYADSLRKVGVPILEDVELALGNGVVVPHPVSELLLVYRTTGPCSRNSMITMPQEPRSSGEPVGGACQTAPNVRAEVRQSPRRRRSQRWPVLRTSQRARPHRRRHRYSRSASQKNRVDRRSYRGRLQQVDPCKRLQVSPWSTANPFTKLLILRHCRDCPPSSPGRSVFRPKATRYGRPMAFHGAEYLFWRC